MGPTRCLLIFAGLLTLASELPAQNGQDNRRTRVDIQVTAVDANERPLPTLVAGEYVRLRVRAQVGNLPARAALSVGAKATFTTTILGQPVSYSINLPAQGTASSLLNPSVSASGRPLATDFNNRTVEEIFDFNIPRDTPAGTVTLAIRIAGSSLAPVQKSFNLQIVRP
jgi:hypothetical protein